MAVMAPEIKESLCRLCRDHGWAFGVCWRFDRRNPRLLIISDSYYEEHIGDGIKNLIPQVHLVGEGTIGVAAISGKHQWVYSETYCMELSHMSSNGNVEMLKSNSEWQHQFLAGIKTIAVISLQSFGVVQFGSTEKICESLEFINQVQHLLSQQNDMAGQTYDQCESIASLVYSGHSYNSHNSVYSLHDIITRELQGNAESSTNSVLCANNFFFESQSVGNRFTKIPSTNSISSFQATNWPLGSATQSYCFPSNSFATNLNANSCWANEIMTLHALPTNSFHHYSANSNSPAKSSSKSSSIASEYPDNFLSFPQDSISEHSSLFQFKDDPTNVQIDSCDQTDKITTVDNKLAEISVTDAMNQLDTNCNWKESSSNGSNQLILDNDLFEGMELDLSPTILREECWDDIITPLGNTRSCSTLNNCDKGLFSGPSFENLLEPAVVESSNLSTSNSVGAFDFNQVSTISPEKIARLAPLAEFSLDKIIQQSSKEILGKSHVRSWIEDSCTMNAESTVTNQLKKPKPEETAKVVRKRARPGESTRPRPKDRQQIQDRVKELREIVPNCSKCSIDSLLDRTVKHMLFLQSVTKYADKLKQTDEPKMIGDESGVVLKDNSGGSAGGGGATWAYEVAGQTMVCPILVEDLSPPGQMLVEMLCEERGFFLEIADIIRGFGLTILKGVMENRASKVWARFLVEANRDVTRMDIFLSLVQFLQQTSNVRTTEQQTKALDKVGSNNAFTNYQQLQAPAPSRLQ